MTLMGQMLGQAQDIVTVASFAAGLVPRRFVGTTNALIGCD